MRHLTAPHDKKPTTQIYFFNSLIALMISNPVC